MASVYAPAPEPATRLGRYRQLSPLACVRVSPICLGGMSIGDKWGKVFGSYMDKDMSFALLDTFYGAGGNFIDTANNYQDESSEEFIGEWMEARGIRDQIVLATKYTSNFKRGQDDVVQKINYIGNNRKSMHLSVNASLKKLRTSYVDILYVHFWDWDSSVEEVMNGLHTLVENEKVLYLGVSDTPAWVVSKANQYARMAGKTPFCIYQGSWSIMDRDLERDILPMCRAEGLAIAPFRVVGGGKIRTDAEEKRREESGEKGTRRAAFSSWLRTEDERRVCTALEEIAPKVGAKTIQAVAIAYVMQKAPHVFPIVGGRKPEQLLANLAALDIALSPEHIKELDAVAQFKPGFPYTIIGNGEEYDMLTKNAAVVDRWPHKQAIRPT
ncbi:Aldo/keto reductase [Epithele typhae]|uniref:Aldo/keto reductase n=1 Tax=Epithele typhae TaxID=378194 RepID=UPI0020083F39|nr:Aldo/keto reductase [Epithele typhae]KAH9919796.1 Aldo/keto reductase [Epithele typhae]